MNSFQKWANDYANNHGFTVTLRGNWVELHKDYETFECMSEEGVLRQCRGVTLAHDPNRPWFPEAAQ